MDHLCQKKMMKAPALLALLMISSHASATTTETSPQPTHPLMTCDDLEKSLKQIRTTRRKGQEALKGREDHPSAKTLRSWLTTLKELESLETQDWQRRCHGIESKKQ